MKSSLFFLISILFVFLPCSYASSDTYDDEFSMFEEQVNKTKTEIYDPFEIVNRRVFIFNDYADQYFIGNVVRLYRFTTPAIFRRGVSNFFNNLKLPFSIANSILQGKFDNSLDTFSVFLLNSTVGIFGIVDFASDEGIRYNEEDFGQTLAFYSVGSGPYLILPFLGPSTARDFSGDLLSRLSSPASIDYFDIKDKIGVSISDGSLIFLNSLNIINKRESISDMLEDIRSSSFDYYSAIRSYYLQNRNSKIND